MIKPHEPVNEIDLLAYADGTLDGDPARRAEVEEYLKQHPEQAERIIAFMHQDDDIHRLYDPVLDEPVPDRLRAVLEQPQPGRMHRCLCEPGSQPAFCLRPPGVGILAGRSRQTTCRNAIVSPQAHLTVIATALLCRIPKFRHRRHLLRPLTHRGRNGQIPYRQWQATSCCKCGCRIFQRKDITCRKTAKSTQTAEMLCKSVMSTTRGINLSCCFSHAGTRAFTIFGSMNVMAFPLRPGPMGRSRSDWLRASRRGRLMSWPRLSENQRSLSNFRILRACPIYRPPDRHQNPRSPKAIRLSVPKYQAA